MDAWSQRAPKSTPLRFVAILVTIALTGIDMGVADDRFHIGRPATEDEIRAWDLDISPEGRNLPPGVGTVAKGAEIFASKCAACHGPTGIEGPADQLIGGQGTLASAKPVKTVGSYWPYATTLFDYIRRAMPLTAPQSLTAEEVYSVVAWLLHQNGIVAKDIRLDAAILPTIRMPNRDGFGPDPRPDVTP
ncbi:cytochrome c [Nitrospira sp.]|nr:cytochrome c [Nitrospira sp.]